MTVGRASSALWCFAVFDLEAVGVVDRCILAQKMRLPGRMGVVTNPAAEAFFSIPDNVQVMKVQIILSETGIGFGQPDLNEIFRMALEAQSIGFWIIRDILPYIKTLHCKRRLSLMGRVAIRTVTSGYGFVKVAVVVNISANVPVADQAVACWLDQFLFMQTGRLGSVPGRATCRR